jgi:hypothetical protein
MFHIDSFYFGAIIVNNRKYDSDIFIGIETVVPRKKSHDVSEKEFSTLLNLKPEVIIFGTGSTGQLKVPSTFHLTANISGTELIVKPTHLAVEEFNKHSRSKKTVGLFHVTC